MMTQRESVRREKPVIIAAEPTSAYVDGSIPGFASERGHSSIVVLSKKKKSGGGGRIGKTR
jgi:hypothetical protein